MKITAQPVHTIPVIKTGYWGQTMEGCLFYSRQWQAVRDVFGSFDEDTQRALTFTPEDGEWPDRVRFWQRQLKPALPSEMYHAAMLKIIRWYAQLIMSINHLLSRCDDGVLRVIYHFMLHAAGSGRGGSIHET